MNQVESNQTVKADFKNYVQMAKTGHYPLFNRAWLEDSLEERKPVSYKIASDKVKNVFNQLARHKSLNKKQTAIMGMDRLTREDFIQSFFKIVEHETLRDIDSLQ